MPFRILALLLAASDLFFFFFECHRVFPPSHGPMGFKLYTVDTMPRIGLALVQYFILGFHLSMVFQLTGSRLPFRAYMDKGSRLLPRMWIQSFCSSLC